MSEDFGPNRNIRPRETPQAADGQYLIKRYFVLAKLLPELERAQEILRGTSHDDRRKGGTLDEIVSIIRRKVNEKAGPRSTIGDKITSADVERYIEESLKK